MTAGRRGVFPERCSCCFDSLLLILSIIEVNMAPPGIDHGLSAKRARFAGPSGLKGIMANGKTSSIAFFASLGGLVYGCQFIPLRYRIDHRLTDIQITRACLLKS